MQESKQTDMDIIKPRIMKGTRDFLPDDMRVREHVIGIIKKRFETYGFAPLATPAMEYYDILTGKYGDEGEGLIFDLAYKGGREVALKYDLTVPMCRVIAQYQDKIVMPFKRYQIQPVWRAEKPQRGGFASSSSATRISWASKTPRPTPRSSR